MIPPSMSQPAAQKRKRRLIQLREAQRRRRNRLKEEKKTFLQIILTEEMQQSLRRFSADRARPMHVCAADLIQEGLAKYLIPEHPLTSDHYAQSAPVEHPLKILPEASQNLCTGDFRPSSSSSFSAHEAKPACQHQTSLILKPGRPEGTNHSAEPGASSSMTTRTTNDCG